MDCLLERFVIKFCVRFEKYATETYRMHQNAFKDNCLSITQVGRWHKVFKEGREEVADELSSGRPITVRTDDNVKRAREVLRSDHRIIIQQIADTLNISRCVAHGIVTKELQMQKFCVELVSKSQLR